MATVLPKQLRFLLADAVREETGGKLTVMGLYTGDEVVLQGALPVEVPEGMQGLALPGLAILVICADGYGTFHGDAQVLAPSGAPLVQLPQIEMAKVKGVTQNIIFPFIPFPVRELGRHRLVLRLNNRNYEYSFIVRHQDASARLPASAAPVTTKRKGARPSQRQVKKNAPARSPKKRLLKT